MSVEQTVDINTNTNTNTNTKQNIDIVRAATGFHQPSIMPPKVMRSISVENYKQLSKGCDYTDIADDIPDDIQQFDFNTWRKIEYNDSELQVGDVILSSINSTLSFGSIGTQSVTYCSDTKSPDIMEIKVTKHNSDWKPTNETSIIEQFINGISLPEFYYDLFAVIKIGNDIRQVTYADQTASWNKMHIASHSGDVHERFNARVHTLNTNETQNVKIKKLRHTIILDIANLAIISQTQPVAVFLYNAGYNRGRLHNLSNYMPQETVCDVFYVTEDDDKKKALFEAPIYTEDSKNNSAVLVSVITIQPHHIETRLVRKYAHGIVSRAGCLHNKIEQKYWSELLENQEQLKQFNINAPTSTDTTEALPALPAMPPAMPPLGIMRSMAGYH